MQNVKRCTNCLMNLMQLNLVVDAMKLELLCDQTLDSLYSIQIHSGLEYDLDFVWLLLEKCLLSLSDP